MDPELVDRIYECSFVPENWPGVLDELAQVADAAGYLTSIHARTNIINGPRLPIYATRRKNSLPRDG